MTTETRSNCKTCGKRFITKGTWFNQLYINRFNDIKFYFHCLRHHRETIKLKGYIYIFKELVFLLLIFLLSIVFAMIWLITLPFALIHEFTGM